MKKLLLFSTLLFLLSACSTVDTQQEKANVEEVLITYYDGLGAGNWDAVRANATKDMRLVEDGLIWNSDSLIESITKNWSKYEIKYEIQIIETTVEKNCARIIYRNHGNASYRSDIIHINWIESASLIKQNDTWKIAMIHSSVDHYHNYDHMTGDDITVPEMSIYDKHERAVSMMYYSNLAGLGLAKKKGISIVEYATSCGDSFKMTWDKEKGFEGLVSGVLFNFENFRYRYDYPIEILENTDDRVLIKWINNYKQEFVNGPVFGVTYEEFNIWFETMWNVIAEYMDSSITYEEIEGDWILITMEKKLKN